MLRALLGEYVRTDPRTLRFAREDSGKPALEPPSAGTEREAPSAPLSFNLSHSGETALYAFTSAGPVGIDVEVARRAVDAVAIAARAFGPAEAARLRELEPAAREREFLRAWVRHEATLKYLGTGIGGSAAPDQEPAPWIGELEMGPRAAAAVAVRIKPSELSCWVWSDPSR
jgi:4'-phosphopantetheinyl transferase